ncbi:MAG: OmpH family outer membrane protein [Shimia sp.]|uniref:OmpH family outer membrane protein n=1 Tax=Shimia sp. TaxID=1954381 RepID=UPI004058F7AD
MFRTLLAATLVIFANVAVAQQASEGVRPVANGVLVVESDRMFAESDFGKRVGDELDRLRAELATQNVEMEELLTAEELELSELRKTMSSAEFVVLARAFDEKVRAIRLEQDTKFRELNELNDLERNVFVQAARPVLSDLMKETGAAVILERRTVLASSGSVDITQVAIERLNEKLGDGSSLETAPE